MGAVVADGSVVLLGDHVFADAAAAAVGAGEGLADGHAAGGGFVAFGDEENRVDNQADYERGPSEYQVEGVVRYGRRVHAVFFTAGRGRTSPPGSNALGYGA